MKNIQIYVQAHLNMVCEGIITYHGPNPACKDYSEEYQALYHEHMPKY